MVALDGVMGLFVSIMDLALMLIGIIVTVLEVQFLTVLNLINDECVQNDFVKIERQMVVDSFILSLFNVVDESVKRGVHCSNCKFVSKSQGGLKNHMRKCAIKR